MATESSQWRKFLQPIATGLVALMAAGTFYLQQHSSDDTESRIKALEIRVDEQTKRSDRFGDDIEKFKVLLSDIRSDVSFIRGRMENGK
jgi:hypothetical protein